MYRLISISVNYGNEILTSQLENRPICYTRDLDTFVVKLSLKHGVDENTTFKSMWGKYNVLLEKLTFQNYDFKK